MLIEYPKKASTGETVWYEVLENGFQIYSGQTKYPQIYQPEPHIPNHSKSYEENAKDMCENICTQSDELHKFAMTEDMYTEMQSNIDYLMLLNDPDSASE